MEFETEQAETAAQLEAAAIQPADSRDFVSKIPVARLGVPLLTWPGVVLALGFAGYLQIGAALNWPGASGSYWVVAGGVLVMAVVGRIANGFYLNRGLRRLAQATEETASAQQHTLTRTARFLQLGTVLLAIAAAVAWPTTGRSLEFTISTVVALLLLANAPALALIVPLAVALATEQAKRLGARINDRAGFEKLAGLDLVLFDKTGTLTTGERRFVAARLTRRGGLESQDELLAVAAGLEQTGDDPVALAIRTEAEARGIESVPVKDIMVIPGIGVSGRFDEFRLYAGGPALLTRQRIQIDVQDLYAADAMNSQGNTVIYLVRDDILLGYVALSDHVRATSADAVWRLQQVGKKVGLLSGDAHGVGANLKKILTLDEVYSEVLPHQKADVVAKLQGDGRSVGMVAHPVIGAAAMSAADVGLAFGVEREGATGVAPIELLSTDPELVSETVELSRDLRGKIRAGIWLVGGYHGVLLVLASGVFGFAFPPILAAALSPALGLGLTAMLRRLWSKA